MNLNLSALGSALEPLARDVAGAIPGGSTVLGVVDRYNATNRTAPTSRGSATPAAPAPSAAVPWWKRGTTLAAAGAALALVLGGLLLFRRRR